MKKAKNKPSRHCGFKFTDADIERMCDLWRQTPQLSLTQIGEVFGVNKNVVNGKIQRLVKAGVIAPRGSPLPQKPKVLTELRVKPAPPTAEESRAYLAKLARQGWPLKQEVLCN